MDGFQRSKPAVQKIADLLTEHCLLVSREAEQSAFVPLGHQVRVQSCRLRSLTRPVDSFNCDKERQASDPSIPLRQIMFGDMKLTENHRAILWRTVLETFLEQIDRHTWPI